MQTHPSHSCVLASCVLATTADASLSLMCARVLHCLHDAAAVWCEGASRNLELCTSAILFSDSPLSQAVNIFGLPADGEKQAEQKGNSR